MDQGGSFFKGSSNDERGGRKQSNKVSFFYKTFHDDEKKNEK